MTYVHSIIVGSTRARKNLNVAKMNDFELESNFPVPYRKATRLFLFTVPMSPPALATRSSSPSLCHIDGQTSTTDSHAPLDGMGKDMLCH